MSTCIVKSNPEFKKLSSLYGEDLASALVMDYSFNVKKIKANEEFYYPSKVEIQEYYRANKNKIASDITKALSFNPYLSEDAIL